MLPFEAGVMLMRAGTGMMMSAFHFGEMMLAAQHVVGRRSAIIADACRDPARADHAEMAKMGAEKIAAFGEAASTLWAEWMALQLDLGRSLAGGHSARRSVGMATRMMGAGGKALAPIHKRATANAKRLRN
jgi:hypothetical protein